MGTPTWSHNGILCICNAFKDMVKVTFINGAKLEDVDGVFNAELGGNKWRAIKIFEGDKVNASGLEKLLLAAVALNAAKPTRKAKPAATGGARKPKKATGRSTKATTAPKAKGATARGESEAVVEERMAGKRSRRPRNDERWQATHVASQSRSRPEAQGEKDGVVLLSGGNPQIAKADGDAPVQAYIAAMPGWKSDLGKRLDALIARNVPDVRKAVKWNSPFYGVEGQGWFLNVHCFTRYVK